MFQGCCFKSCIFIVAWRVTWSYDYSLFKLFENPNYIQILEQNFIVLTYSLHNVWGLVYLFLDLTIKSCPLIFRINARNSNNFKNLNHYINITNVKLKNWNSKLIFQNFFQKRHFEILTLLQWELVNSGIERRLLDSSSDFRSWNTTIVQCKQTHFTK